MIRLYWPQLLELAGHEAAAGRARDLAERVWELTELLDALPDERLDLGSVAPCAAVYHRSCHMLRELHVAEQPEALLDRVDGCDVAAWAAADQCCGFKLPEASVAMADEKLDVLPEGTEVIVGADASCLMQLRTRAGARGLAVRTEHIAQVLERALPADGGGGT
jgi:L-lactate dehydrogenase complex protein LldE